MSQAYDLVGITLDLNPYPVRFLPAGARVFYTRCHPYFQQDGNKPNLAMTRLNQVISTGSSHDI